MNDNKHTNDSKHTNRPDPLSIYKLLPQTNCKDCGLASCMAFAHALIRQEKSLGACPHLSEDVLSALSPMLDNAAPDEGFRSTIEALRVDVRQLRFEDIAEGLGAKISDGKLYINCLGRDFIMLPDGHMESPCHVNVWVELMLLNYCKMQGTGGLTGRWISYGELKTAAPTAPYFEKRCEEPLRAIADAHTEVFLDLMEIFKGVKQEGFEADHAFIIHPLPRVPFLVLYTRPDEDFASGLRILLDSSIDSYIPKEAITYTGRGIVEMFKRITSKHDNVSEKLMGL